MNQNQVKYRRFERFFEKYAISGDPRKAAERFVGLLGQQSILLPDAEESLREIAKKLSVVIVTNGIAAVQKGMGNGRRHDRV